MDACIDRGLATDGILPGGLKVRRRARAIHQALLAERGNNLAQPHIVNDWLSVYAMAVNEENAAGGQVVTAPTNGAAGVVPAVIRYYRDHCVGATHEGIRDFLLTAAAVGGIIKTQRLDLRRRGRLPGRGRLRRRHGRRRPLRRARRHATPRSRTPPRSRSSTTSA